MGDDREAEDRRGELCARRFGVQVAQRYGLNANMLFTWRRQFQPPEPSSSMGAWRSCSSAESGSVSAATWMWRLSRGREGVVAPTTPLPSGARVWLATGHTDMRKDFEGLALIVQETLKRDPHSGHLFAFRGRRGQQAIFCI
jgi:hypothetical protein